MEPKSRVRGEAWARILEEQAASGQSASHFCRERGIRPSSFFSAKKRARLAQVSSIPAEFPSDQSLLSSKRSAGVVQHRNQRPVFLSVQVSDEVVATSCAERSIRVQLRSGHPLWVSSEFDSAHLGRLVAVLESAS